MRRLYLCFVAGILVLDSVDGFCSSNAWRWMEGGRWVYGDKYPPGTKNPERLIDGAPIVPLQESVSLQAEKARKLFPVTVYGVDCSGCVEVVKILSARKIPFVSKDPSQQDVFIEFKKYSPESMAPVILIGDRVLVGYEAGALNGALDDAGYEKASVPAR